jgi:hypothetical protein
MRHARRASIGKIAYSGAARFCAVFAIARDVIRGAKLAPLSRGVHVEKKPEDDDDDEG